MSDCLVTTLKEAVTDNELLKLGDIDITMKNHSNPNSPSKLTIWPASGSIPLTLSVISDGYFTDSTGASNLGKTKEIHGSDSNKAFWASPGEQTVRINSKYNLFILNCSDNTSDIKMDVSDIYSSHIRDFEIPAQDLIGSLSDIVKANSNLKTIRLWTGRAQSPLYFTADLSMISESNTLTKFDAGNVCTVTGKLSDIPNSLTHLSVYNSRVTGTLSQLATKTNLVSVNVSGTAVTGDTSDLAGLTNLTTFTYANTAITGTWPLV